MTSPLITLRPAIETRARVKLASEPFPLIRVKDIPEITEQEWLVEGLIPTFSEGAAGYVFGPPKSRKSMMLADIALSVATGTPALGRFSVKRTGAVVGFFAEDQKSETARRMQRLARGRQVNVPSNLSLIDIPKLALDSEEHQYRLEATLTGVSDLALVWLDPMVRLHTINDNKAEQLGPIHSFLRTLSRLCPATTIILAHHTNKSGDSRGSTEYGAFGDFNLYLSTPDAHKTKITRIENRGGPPGESFEFSLEDGHTDDGDTLRVVVEDKTSKADGEDETCRLRQAIEKLKSETPGMSGIAAKGALRALGFKVGNDTFGPLWKEAAP